MFFMLQVGESGWSRLSPKETASADQGEGGGQGGHAADPRSHGRDGGQLHRLRLYSGDRVVRVSGRSGLGPGVGVDQITFHSKK